MNKNKSKKLIEQFFELEKQIWTLVDKDEVHYRGIIDYTGEPFGIGERYVMWGEVGNPCGGGIYGTAVFRGDDYTIVAIYDGCGAIRPFLFENSEEISYETMAEGHDDY